MAFLDRLRPSRRQSVAKAAAVDPTTEIGVGGLKVQGGIVTDEFLRELQGVKGMQVLRQMGDNDAIVGTGLLLLRMWLRAGTYSVAPYAAKGEKASPEAVDAAAWLRGSMDDMSHTWSAFTDELFTHTPQFGWSWYETTYKRRNGEVADSPGASSDYEDGLWGWRKFSLRPAESWREFEFDDSGGVQAMIQNTRAAGDTPIPIEKSMLFRTTTMKGNPLGRSILRNAYRAWWLRMRVEEIEAIGTERDLVGVPVIRVPEEVLNDPAYADSLAKWEQVAADLKNDEQAGLVIPSIFDEAGNQLVEVSLIASPGSRTFDTPAIIARYTREILMSMMADLALLGHESVGTQALASEKVDLFQMGMTAFLQDAVDVINRHEVPRLWRLNGWDAKTRPTITVTPHVDVDIDGIVDAVAKLASSGAPLWPSPELARWVEEKTGIPVPEEFDDAGVFTTPPS